VWNDSFEGIKRVEHSVPYTASRVSRSDKMLSGEMKSRNPFVNPPYSTSRPVDAQQPNGCKKRIKYTISTDNTACEKSRHKLLFIALTGGSKHTLPTKIP
jgi:hypothetical protein